VAGRCNASQDARDAWDAGDMSLASGRNADGSDAGSVFADVPFRSVGPSSVTPSRGIALPPWLCPTPWIDVMTCLTVHHGFGGPSTGVFLYRRSTILFPWAAFLAVRVFSFLLVSLRKGLGLSTCTFLCIVSLRVWGFCLRR